MQNASLLVVLDKSSKPAELEGLATTARDLGLRLSLLVLALAPQLPTAAYGVGYFGTFVTNDGWQEDVDKVNAQLKRTCQAMEAFFAAQGVSIHTSALSADLSALPEAVARIALTCDFVVVSDALRSTPALFETAVQAAIFRSPTGVILNSMSHQKALTPARVLVAWNSGLPAARALHAALPILKGAAEVFVAIIDPVMNAYRDGEDPGADVAQWLSHHGCKVSVQQMPSGGQTVAVALLKKAKETGADLIVMGGYDHSRMREIIFGGTTRSMVEQLNYPILLAH